MITTQEKKRGRKMKDSAKLLNFNVNRELKFAVFRQVEFDPRRDLSFNLNRDLNFDLHRDLGFGKRGVVFRGYVCPVCRAPVARDALRCDECGVRFEQPAKKAPKKKAQVSPGASRLASQDRMDGARTAPAPQRRSTFECPVCGKILYIGAEQCPGCMTQFMANAPIPPNRPGAGAPKIVACANCGYGIQPQDRFCRRCGSPKPAQADRTLVSWDEYTDTGRGDGLVSWDEYSKRTGGG
jgi:hypothetical protein